MDVLDVATSQKGTGERADGSTKYGKWLDEQPPKTSVRAKADWCGAFLSWVIAQDGPDRTATAGGLNRNDAEVPVWFAWMTAHHRISHRDSPIMGDSEWWEFIARTASPADDSRRAG
ncbi:hypothetical protein [Actinoallomurus soli]|uniref:hypothetical protein n=1 Tax=Actinoallomurus soli TaxID=2952535 RepID=UPI0020937097|nr:hypothetical protein [Actinoallomurus soli]MCO5971784.1 hypothetical protein [Actinoallomurus soli]